MTWTAPEVIRAHVPLIADERAALEAWLTFHRNTLLLKCAGLTADQLKLKSVEPSTMSLLGLVRHMSDVERHWFRRWLPANHELKPLYWTDEFPDGDFDLVADADAEADYAVYLSEVAAADTIAASHALDDKFLSRRATELDLRWIYLHMIEEYARHNGHADFLRERIDGATGQ